MNLKNYLPPISASSSTSNYIPAKADSNKFTAAIKAYKDEYFTGLTDEEREQIKKELKSYLQANPIKNEADRIRYNDYCKSLLKKYGYKGDPDELINSLSSEVQDELTKEAPTTSSLDATKTPNTTLTDFQFAYIDSTCSGVTSKERVLKNIK